MKSKPRKYLISSVTLACAIISLLASRTASATIETDGALDQTFGPVNFTNGQVDAAVLQPDGKLIIAGGFNKVHGWDRRGIARLNADGTLDPSFDAGGSADAEITGVILQPDGRIIIYGGFYSVDGNSRIGVARLNSNGSLDLSFDTGSSFDGGLARSAILQPDGKIVVVGLFQLVQQAMLTHDGVARFNNDGTVDSSFGSGALPSSNDYVDIFQVARQNLEPNSGKIILQGHFDSYAGHPVSGLVRVNADGSFDETFNAGATVADPATVTGLFVQADDQIVVFGNFVSFYGSACSGIARLTVSGQHDTTFATQTFDDYGFLPTIMAVTAQADGKLVVGGFFHSLGGTVAHNLVRLQASGARDSSFTANGVSPYAQNVHALLIRASDGKIFVGGYFSDYGGEARNNIAWANSDGSIETTFAGLAGVTDFAPSITALATQADGKILVGGSFTSLNGVPRNNLVRLNPDSTVDASFGVTLGTNRDVRSIVIEPDGKILIAGGFGIVDGVTRRGIARLHADGSLDASFDPAAGADGYIHAVARDSFGDLYVGGSFQNFNGVPRSHLAKLSSTGTLDSTFNPGTGPNGRVYTIVPPNGLSGPVIGGLFTSCNGISAGRIARLNATTGAVDTTFNSGGGFSNAVYTVLLGADGKYYVGGFFSRYNGFLANSLARLNANGLFDSSYHFGSNIVRALAFQNGKVFVGGNLRSPNPPQLMRVTNTLQLDTTFASGTGPSITPENAYASPWVYALAVQPDGKLLAGGYFDRYNGTLRTSLVRLTDSKLIFSAVSRKIHGAGGPALDVNLPLTGAPGIECRSGGANGDYQVVFNFGGAVSLGNAVVTSGAGTVIGATGSGTSTLTVNLTGITSAQRITLTLSNVSTGISTTDLAVPIGFLVGDTNGDGFVNAGDAVQTRNRSGQATDTTNFRSDVNADGFVNSGDTTVVRARSGIALP